MNLELNVIYGINAITVILFIYLLYTGFKNGFVYQLLSLIMTIICFASTVILLPLTKHIKLLPLSFFAQTNDKLLNYLIYHFGNYVIWMLIIFVGFKLVFYFVKIAAKLINHIVVIGFINRLFGLVFSVINFLVLCGIFNLIIASPLILNKDFVYQNTIFSHTNRVSEVLIKLLPSLDIASYVANSLLIEEKLDQGKITELSEILTKFTDRVNVEELIKEYESK